MTATRTPPLRITPLAPLRLPPGVPDASAHGDTGEHRALLAAAPLVVLGAERVPPLAVDGVRPTRQTCFGPRGAVLGDSDSDRAVGRDIDDRDSEAAGDGRGPLWICDTGHHRLLGWRALPDSDQAPADWVIGQPDFEHEGRNGKGPVTAASVNVPTGICRVGRHGLAVADAWNHRVLVWSTMPADDNVPADVVLGQRDFTSGAPNAGRAAPSAGTLYWPYGVAELDGRLVVADAGNRRVLIWDEPPVENGQLADQVVGQRRFDTRDENAGGAPDAASMRWPHGLAVWRGHLAVADAGNNRIMLWRRFPTEPGQRADFILGQPDETSVDHNQSLYWPRAGTLNMPYGLAAAGDWLIAADTASSRLVGWHVDDLATGAGARALAGQDDFQQKGDNRWQAPGADSLCWPYGVHARGRLIAVADTGNNRVSVWELAV